MIARDTAAMVLANLPLTDDIYCLELDCPEISGTVRPGQFVHLAVPGFFLRRPFSVAGAFGGRLEIVFRSQGPGTRAMAQVEPGESLNVLGPLGRGFNPPQGRWPVLLGGGIGVAPLVMLARELKYCTLVMGAATSRQLWLTKLDLPETVEVCYCTDDGSQGFHGNVVQAAADRITERDWVAACGPKAMLKGLQQLLKARQIPGQFALEEQMACGIGACMGCTCHTSGGPALVCKDGPVFAAGEVVL